MANLYDLLRSRFEGDPERPFLAVPEAEPRSYADLDSRSAAFAAALVESAVEPGDRVVVQVDKCPDAVALYLACLRIGAVIVPLNVAYTAEEVRYYLDDATPRVVVVRPEPEFDPEPERRPEFNPEPERGSEPSTWLTLDEEGHGSLPELAAGRSHTAVLPRDTDDIAAMLYTSGTTGRPKGAMLTHGNLASNALALNSLWGFGPQDVLLHALPVFHVHGLFVALHCAMLSAAKVIFLPRFDTRAVRRGLREATVMMGVPTFYNRLLAEPDFGRGDCTAMRLFISGSAPLSETVFRAFTERTGHTILERYGMTEAGMITSNPLRGDRKAGSVGFALPDVDLRVVDEASKELEPGEVGEVEARGPNLFAGYWQMEEKTRAAFHANGFFRTGDIGSLDSEGRLQLAGRASDMIISGGFNIYPKEIELCLDEAPGIGESAVVGLPDADFGEQVAAFVVPAPGHALQETDIRRAVEGRLARFKHPKQIFIVDTLPRNAMGKVQKAALRKAHGGG
ncbi:MAG: AMP-binding protein [bacterium]|nr:AMP-binding protein [bacterium]MCP5067393.1 AMP-binding protein [bacterium]